MRLEAQKFRFDIDRSAPLIAEFTAGRQFSDYERDAMLRSAVERQFEVIGEALAQLARVDAETAIRIAEYRRIMAFRNILVHGYADVDHRLVWDIVESKLATLRTEVSALLTE